MLTLLFIIMLVYTSLEVCFWYYRWWKHIDHEPMPIVKGLLLAIFLAHFATITAVVYEYIYTAPPWHDPVFYAIISLNGFCYMLPIWRQHIHRCTTPLSFLIRVAIISGVTTWGIYAFIW